MKYKLFIFTLLGSIFLLGCNDEDNNGTANTGESSTAEERRWTVKMDFNDGTLGEKVNLDAGGLSVYDDEQVYEGDMSCRMGIKANTDGFGSWGGIISHPATLTGGDEIWLRLRIYFPSGFQYYANAGGNRLKFLRFHTATADGDNVGYNDIYFDQEGSSNPFKYIYEGRQKWVNIGEPKDLPEYDVWETYEFYVRFHAVAKDEGGEAVVRFWKNGELLKEITNLNTLKDQDNIVRQTNIFTYWNGENPPEQHLWVDDIVLTSELPKARDADGNACIGVQ